MAMVMTTLWMVTIIPVTVVQAADFRGQGFDLSSYNGTVNWEQVAEADMDFVTEFFKFLHGNVWFVVITSDNIQSG